LREAKLQEKVHAKDAFVSLLTQMIVKNNNDNNTPTNSTTTIANTITTTATSSNFATIRPLLVKDDRFYAVEDEITREELY